MVKPTKFMLGQAIQAIGNVDSQQVDASIAIDKLGAPKVVLLEKITRNHKLNL